MKVFLSFDIEGVAGITDNNRDLDTDLARKLSTLEVNAAVEGALAGGATEVVVYDGHGFRNTLLFDQIHPKAKFQRGRVTDALLNMPEFNSSYDAVLFVGWHARASAPGVLSHTLNSRALTGWRVNGVPVGEPELAAAYAGYHNVPLVLFTGDDRSCEEVKTWAPDCELVVTKVAIDRFSAICDSKEVVLEKIASGSERAIRRTGEIKPFNFNMPCRIEIDAINDHIARAMAEVPGVEQTGLLTVSFESGDYEEAYRCVHALQMISFACILVEGK